MGAASRRTWRWLGITSCACCFAMAASWERTVQQEPAQFPPETQPPVFRAERNEVEVVVTVRDRNGQSVGNLTQSDFEIRDNGKPQIISSFALRGATQQAANRQPIATSAVAGVSTASFGAIPRRFVALFFDDVHTDPGDFARVQKAARQFLQGSSQSEDRVAIFKASEKGDITFSNDKPKVLAAIDGLRAHPAKNTSTMTQCPRITNYEAYLIVNDLDPEALNFVAMRLQNCMCPPPKGVVEYREVISIDGHEVKGHAARSAKLWREIAEAHSPQEEVRRITADSERYDIGLAETGFTLFEGMPLQPRCAGNFIFREVRKEIASGRQVRVFAYRQVHPCDAVAYHFGLPAQFADSPMLQTGELALDAETGQIVREERNVYTGNLDKKPTRVARIAMGYGESRFGVLVPKTIVVETFLPREGVNGISTGFQPYARMVHTYGPFSRFEVSVGEKVSAPTH